MSEPKLTDYMDAAIEAKRLPSDRALAKALELDQATISTWRSGRYLPKNHQMIALSRLAGADEEQALVLLNIWRAEKEQDERARELYRRLLRRLTGRTGTAVAIALALGVSGPEKPESPGMERGGNRLTVELPALYIMRFLRRVARRLAPRPAPAWGLA